MKTAYIAIKNAHTGDTDGFQKVTGKTWREIYQTMCRMLSVGGLRGIGAYYRPNDEMEPNIYCSLYEGKSYIRSTDGKTIYSA